MFKISLFIFKTCKKLNKGFRYNRLWIYLTHSLWGGAGQPHPQTEILNIALEVLRTNAISFTAVNWVSCENFEQDWTILRGVLAWSAISLYPRHLHSQYMYFGLNMYFLSNTLLNSLLQVPTLAHQVVYWLTCALLGKFWEHLNPPPATPITGLLELKYHTNNHCYTGCNSETYAIRFSIRQFDFLAKFQNYRPIFGTGFGWFASSFNHFTTIFEFNNFCTEM